MNPEQDLFERLKAVATKAPTAPSENSAMEKELEKGDPDSGTPVTLRNLFTHHDTHPVVLDYALMKAFELSWLDWTFETIWSEIQRVFKMNISEHTRAKIQTVKTVHVSNGPWTQWHVFEKIIQGLNNNVPQWEIMQAPSLEQLYAGIDILEQLRIRKFEDEVKQYMAAAVLNDEVMYVPPPLDFIQVEVSQPFYKCKACGNSYSALFHDGFCDTCTKKFDASKGLGMRPDITMIEDGRGQNMDLHVRFDPARVAEKWETVKTKPSNEVDLEENDVDTQIGKLLVARDYMNIRRRQLADQLTTLKSWLGAV